MHNPITYLENKWNELESGFKDWLAKQSLPVEVVVVTLASATQGAAIGGFMGTFNKQPSSSFPTRPPPLDSQNMASFPQTQGAFDASINPHIVASFPQSQVPAGGPLIHARNYAVMMGVNAGIYSVMKRLRGKEDVQTNMVAAFGSGVMFSLVSGTGGPNQAANAFTTGVFFSLVQGGVFKVGKKFSRPSVDNSMYIEARAMLARLGLEKYEQNFKNGSLTDNTLPQLTDRALEDVRIPPGPRLAILDHIQSVWGAGVCFHRNTPQTILYENKEVKKGGRRI